MQRCVWLAAVVLAVSQGTAAAQEPVAVCQEQSELEQVLGSGGDIMPDGCRGLAVSVLEQDGERLCLLDFTETDGGFLGQLREAAVAEAWWVRCENLETALR